MKKMVYGTFAAWIVLAAFGFLINGVVLSDTLHVLEVAGSMRSAQGGPVAIAFWLITLAITAHMLGHFMYGFWFEKKRDGHKVAWRYGLAMGTIYTMPSLSGFFFYSLPMEIPIAALVFGWIAFPLAAIVYSKTYEWA